MGCPEMQRSVLRLDIALQRGWSEHRDAPSINRPCALNVTEWAQSPGYALFLFVNATRRVVVWIDCDRPMVKPLSAMFPIDTGLTASSRHLLSLAMLKAESNEYPV
jgi:hypothetical protein